MNNPATDTTLCFATATELLDGYRRRDYKPSEVLADHFAQIDRTNPATGLGVNALTEEMRETSTAAALAADEAYVRGGSLPPLLGVPLVTKEKHAIAGLAVTQGLGNETGAVPRRRTSPSSSGCWMQVCCCMPEPPPRSSPAPPSPIRSSGA